MRTGYREGRGIVWAARPDFEFQEPEAQEAALVQAFDEMVRRLRED